MRIIVLGAALALSACSEPAVEPPPGEPVSVPEVADPRPMPQPASYVGLWAADPAWCDNTEGAERPIRITETRFEGYENLCDMAEVRPVGSGWTATLTCQAEGQVTSEPIGLSPEGDRLTVTWIETDRSATFTRCPS